MRVKLDVAPSGPGCGHVRIRDADTGAALEVCLYSQLVGSESVDDSDLVRSIRATAKAHLALNPNVPDLVLRQVIEARSYP